MAEQKKLMTAKEMHTFTPADYSWSTGPAFQGWNDNRTKHVDFLQDQYNQMGSQLKDPSGFGNFITGGNNKIQAQNTAVRAQMQALASQIEKMKAQFGALDAQQAPTMSAQQIARLKALEEESKASSLAEDPLFQGDRSMLVHGANNALGVAKNRQNALGIQGAFANSRGDVRDIYDTLGMQLSQLGQASRATKEGKRDVVAQSYQAYEDSLKAFENARLNAEAAIIAGNLDAANTFMQQAAQAEINLRNSQAEMTQKIVGNIGNAALGFAVGGGLGGAEEFSGDIGDYVNQDQYMNLMKPFEYGSPLMGQDNQYNRFMSFGKNPNQFSLMGDQNPFEVTAPSRVYRKGG